MILLVVACVLSGALAQFEPDCFCLDEIEAATGLISPTDFQSPPDGSGRLMISEQPGKIFIVRPDGTLNPTPFLDFSDDVISNSEDGLLAFTFHPDFANNRKLYVRYTYQDVRTTRLSEIQADINNPDVVDYNTERPLGLDTFEEFNGHNGGGLLFGTDNYLYIFIGDGGYQSVGDMANHAQNKSEILGKVLRIDVDNRTGELEYGIPPDNPYLSDPDAVPELYALGLRNPWKASMDPGDRSTGAGLGRMFMGDVGQHTWEEVDILERGGNYGWSGREGPECYKPELCGNTEPEVFPVVYYNRTAIGGSAVIAGHVYRGCMNPNFNGWFFFADFGNKKIFRMLEESPDVWNTKEIFTCSTCPTNTTNIYQQFIQFFGVDHEGELYLGTQGEYDANLPLGKIYKFVDPNNTQPSCPPQRRR